LKLNQKEDTTEGVKSIPSGIKGLEEILSGMMFPSTIIYNANVFEIKK
jgi:hypothetical protein